MNTTVNEKGSAAVIWTVKPETYNGLSDRQVLNRLKKIADAERRKKEIEKEIETLRAEIIGNAVTVSRETDSFIVRYTEVESRRFDSKRFQKENPEVADAYMQNTKTNRFTYKLK